MTTPRPTIAGTGKAYPSGGGNSPGGESRAEPNWLGREDVPHGRWTVEDCRPVRGEPRTSIDQRVMFAPSSDAELDRVIRGHEMLHAKLSPNHSQMEAWVARGHASQTALIVAEELRINYLAQQAGFDVKSHLADGDETQAGEILAQRKDWAGAVATCFATVGTAGHKKFLNGIRRHNRAWGDALNDIGKRALREIKKAHKSGSLASTESCSSWDAGLDPELAPFGFSHTERIGEWVDRLASFPPPEKPKPKGKGKDGDGEGGNSEPGDGQPDPSKGKDGDGDRDGNPHGKVGPVDGHGPTPSWAELIVSREPMPRIHNGNIGKKRTATNMGRRPRRLHRYMTDPAKRVFDRNVRGSGGMVIIDASGSMSFTTEQIAEIVDNAKGATVAIYSIRGTKNPNFWVIADKGRMVQNVEYIDYGHGNGVDYPAIVWGVENRQNSKTPLVWVTDGGVSGAGDSFHDGLTLQCIEYARKHGYIVVSDVDEAISELSKLRIGGTAKSRWPMHFRRTWHRYNGTQLA